MKILCFERDNTTYQSCEDTHGNTYRASFELFPFHEGKDFAVYKGMLNGKGPKRGMFCVAKAQLIRRATAHDWSSLDLISHTAENMATQFNQQLMSRSVRFTRPLVAQMNRVSDFNGVMKLFHPHEKKLKKKEYVVLEDYIEGKFQRFSSASGVSTVGGETNLLQAFSHFTWHHTGQLVVSGLQGVTHNGRYQLTSPTIHSLGGTFGPGDSRLPGIVEFFSHHSCNNICCGWSTPLTQTHKPRGINIYPVVPATAPPGYYTC